MSAAESWATAMARNMSAPPRTTLTFSAVAPEPDAVASLGDMDAGTGLQFVCRLDGCAHVSSSRRQTGAGAQDAVHVHQRIRAAVLYGRAEITGSTKVSKKMVEQVKAPAIESLADELQAMLAAIALPPSEFPAVGLLLPVNDESSTRQIMPGLLRTLAVLARRRGSVFVRDADPIVWTAMQGRPMDLWLPALTGVPEVSA